LCQPGEASQFRFDFSTTGRYQLSLKAVRISGRNNLILLLPISQSKVTLKVNFGKEGVTYLSNIDGIDAIDNPNAVKNVSLLSGKDNQIVVDVELNKGHSQARIKFTLNDKEIFTWRGKPSSLTHDKRWDAIASNYVGVGSDYGAFKFHDVVIITK
jgi:hypothetical protein